MDIISTDRSLKFYCAPKQNEYNFLQQYIFTKELSRKDKPKYQEIAETKKYILDLVVRENRPSLIRLLLLLDRDIEKAFLIKYYDSVCWLERYAIAQNTNTPETIRQRLAQDGNRIVRAAAKAHLTPNG